MSDEKITPPPIPPSPLAGQSVPAVPPPHARTTNASDEGGKISSKVSGLIRNGGKTESRTNRPNRPPLRKPYPPADREDPPKIDPVVAAQQEAGAKIAVQICHGAVNLLKAWELSLLQPKAVYVLGEAEGQKLEFQIMPGKEDQENMDIGAVEFAKEYDLLQHIKPWMLFFVGFGMWQSKIIALNHKLDMLIAQREGKKAPGQPESKATPGQELIHLVPKVGPPAPITETAVPTPTPGPGKIVA